MSKVLQVLLSGIVEFTCSIPVQTLCSSGTLSQPMTSSRAATASTRPNPYLCDTRCPAPFSAHDESFWSFFRALSTRMCCTSLHVRPGLASSMRAMIPETSGVALEVPPKVSVVLPSS